MKAVFSVVVLLQLAFLCAACTPHTSQTASTTSEATSSSPVPAEDRQTVLQAVAKSLSPDALDIAVMLQKFNDKNGGWFIDVTLHQGTARDDARDWNNLAGAASPVARGLFAQPDVKRIRVRAVDDAKREWAHIEFQSQQLPPNFAQLTYLEQLSFARVDGSYPDSIQSLKDFYAKYPNAKPHQDSASTAKQ